LVSYAEDLPYWKTSKISPDTWLQKAVREVERAGGEVTSEGFGRHHGRSAFMIRFELEGDSFRVEWPVLGSKYEGLDRDSTFLGRARRQAATMLYHDVKSSCVKARALGARAAFLAHLEMEDGRTAHQLSQGEIRGAFPLLLPAAEVDGEVID
jgi:hypothetical protein